MTVVHSHESAAAAAANDGRGNWFFHADERPGVSYGRERPGSVAPAGQADPGAGGGRRRLFKFAWLEQREEAGITMSRRRRIWLLFEAPSSSYIAYSLYVFLMSTIVLSVIVYCVSTMQSVTVQDSSFQIIEYYCTAIFTVRSIAFPSRGLRFLRSLYLISMDLPAERSVVHHAG